MLTLMRMYWVNITFMHFVDALIHCVVTVIDVFVLVTSVKMTVSEAGNVARL